MGNSIYIDIVRELKKRRELAKESEIFRILSKKYNISLRELDKILLRLEIKHIILVENLKRNERLIRLLE